MERVLFTKFAGWRYEEEWRVWFPREECDPTASNHYFRNFSEDIRLSEVIVGPLCTVTKSTLTKATRGYSPPPRMIEARLAFRSFRVVKDQRGFGSEA